MPLVKNKNVDAIVIRKEDVKNINLDLINISNIKFIIETEDGIKFSCIDVYPEINKEKRFKFDKKDKIIYKNVLFSAIKWGQNYLREKQATSIGFREWKNCIEELSDKYDCTDVTSKYECKEMNTFGITKEYLNSLNLDTKDLSNIRYISEATRGIKFK